MSGSLGGAHNVEDVEELTSNWL